LLVGWGGATGSADLFWNEQQKTWQYTVLRILRGHRETGLPCQKIVALTDANTEIEFTGTKTGGKHDGGFKGVSGVIVMADGVEPQVDVEIDCGSLYSDNFLLTWHLKGADFFNVKKHPKARFTSTSVRPSETGYVVTGDLTFLGVTMPVSFPATMTGGEAIRLRGKCVINRHDFGMTYGKGKIHDNVEVRFDVNAAR
jgi:polyisoprenoid-binding protein YceI